MQGSQDALCLYEWSAAVFRAGAQVLGATLHFVPQHRAGRAGLLQHWDSLIALQRAAQQLCGSTFGYLHLMSFSSLQVAPGSIAEGGNRYLVEYRDFRVSQPAAGGGIEPPARADTPPGAAGTGIVPSIPVSSMAALADAAAIKTEPGQAPESAASPSVSAVDVSKPTAARGCEGLPTPGVTACEPAYPAAPPAAATADTAAASPAVPPEEAVHASAISSGAADPPAPGAGPSAATEPHSAPTPHTPPRVLTANPISAASADPGSSAQPTGSPRPSDPPQQQPLTLQPATSPALPAEGAVSTEKSRDDADIAGAHVAGPAGVSPAADPADPVAVAGQVDAASTPQSATAASLQAAPQGSQGSAAVAKVEQAHVAQAPQSDTHAVPHPVSDGVEEPAPSASSAPIDEGVLPGGCSSGLAHGLSAGGAVAAIVSSTAGAAAAEPHDSARAPPEGAAGAVATGAEVVTDSAAAIAEFATAPRLGLAEAAGPATAADSAPQPSTASGAAAAAPDTSLDAGGTHAAPTADHTAPATTSMPEVQPQADQPPASEPTSAPAPSAPENEAQSSVQPAAEAAAQAAAATLSQLQTLPGLLPVVSAAVHPPGGPVGLTARERSVVAGDSACWPLTSKAGKDGFDSVLFVPRRVTRAWRVSTTQACTLVVPQVTTLQPLLRENV